MSYNQNRNWVERGETMNALRGNGRAVLKSSGFRGKCKNCGNRRQIGLSGICGECQSQKDRGF